MDGGCYERFHASCSCARYQAVVDQQDHMVQRRCAGPRRGRVPHEHIAAARAGKYLHDDRLRPSHRKPVLALDHDSGVEQVSHPKPIPLSAIGPVEPVAKFRIGCVTITVAGSTNAQRERDANAALKYFQIYARQIAQPVTESK